MATAAGPNLSLPAALKIMRTFAAAGCQRVADIQDKLLRKTFYNKNHFSIETEINRINYALSEAVVVVPNGNPANFIPLPFSKNGHFLISFFRPKFRAALGECDIELILVSDPEDESFGLRFEKGLRGVEDMHGYAHVQWTRRFHKGSEAIETSLPPHLSEKYPALPLPTHGGYAAWLCSLVALTGLRRDGQGGLVHMFQDQSDYFDGDGFSQIVQSLTKATNEIFWR